MCHRKCHRHVASADPSSGRYMYCPPDRRPLRILFKPLLAVGTHTVRPRKVQTMPSDAPDATRVIGASTGIAQEFAGVVFLSARYRSVWQNVGDVNTTTSKL